MSQEFNYMLLNRLQIDCQSFIDYGGSLWGITPQDHADKMVELWKGLKIKPEWLSLKELKQLYFSLTKKELVL